MTASFIVGKIYFVLPLAFFSVLAGFRIPRRRYFILRFAVCVLLSVAEMLLFVYFFGYKPYNFFVLYVIDIIMMLVCFKCSVWTALFCATVGYCIEHLTERIFELFAVLLPHDCPEIWRYTIRTVILVAVGAAIWFFIIRRSGEKGIVVDNVLQILAVLFISPVIIFLNQYALSFIRPLGSPEAEFCLYLISAMFAFVGILFEYSMCASKRSEAELGVIRRILCEERERYDNEKANIERINVKCHDLRHQLAAYREKLDRDELQSIYKAIELYDSDIRTGCGAFDVVINEKMRWCHEYGIKLTCLIDGRKLKFLPEHEIYSLFGNALENAINASIVLPPEKRIISITDRSLNGMTIVCVENYFSGQLHFEDGLPCTTKNENGHGYGLKSIRYIAESHGGMISASADGEIFNLTIAVPMSENAALTAGICKVRPAGM